MDGIGAFVDRVKNDATLLAATGADAVGQARVGGGWPESFTDESAFPQVTLTLVADAVIRPGVRRWRVQADVWVWIDGSNGGPAKIETIDERLLALLDEASWSASGTRYTSVALAARDLDEGAGAPLRRTRDYDILGG